MGSSQVRYLTWRNFLEAYENYYKPPLKQELNIPHRLYKLTKSDEKERKNTGNIGTWKISRVKTGTNFITFNTPKSSRSLLIIYKIPPRQQ
jgi:hypothetical protein